MGRGQGRRAVVIAAIALAAAAAVHDFAVPVPDGYGARVALAAIDQYRAHISHHLQPVVACRFVPTCSRYGRESIRKYGLAVGGWRTVRRIARCGPWTPMGTVDPP